MRYSPRNPSDTEKDLPLQRATTFNDQYTYRFAISMMLIFSMATIANPVRKGTLPTLPPTCAEALKGRLFAELDLETQINFIRGIRAAGEDVEEALLAISKSVPHAHEKRAGEFGPTTDSMIHKVRRGHVVLFTYEYNPTGFTQHFNHLLQKAFETSLANPKKVIALKPPDEISELPSEVAENTLRTAYQKTGSLPGVPYSATEKANIIGDTVIQKRGELVTVRGIVERPPISWNDNSLGIYDEQGEVLFYPATEVRELHIVGLDETVARSTRDFVQAGDRVSVANPENWSEWSTGTVNNDFSVDFTGARIFSVTLDDPMPYKTPEGGTGMSKHYTVAYNRHNPNWRKEVRKYFRTLDPNISWP